MARRSEVVLITGCSSGIGRATVALAAEHGHRVVATARRPETLEDLPAGVFRARLDVTDADSIRVAVDAARKEFGEVTALVNNAGYGVVGPIELLPDEDVRAQFDANVYGPLRVIRAVLPAMRAARRGTIVNVSSIGGRISTPFMGAYCASKFAIEALSDSLRMELRPFGVQVAIVEPGPIRTEFGGKALGPVEDRWLHDDSNPYAAFMGTALAGGRTATRFERPPDAVAEAICKAIESPSPRARYTVTLPAKVGPQVTKVLPAKLVDAVQARMLGIK